VKALRPKVVVPIHYKTFPVLLQDASGFAEGVRAQTSASCLLLEPGESTEVRR
jgi:L-ascorbate metabolism protein UlaG (beta-lactamase superfamily)